LPTVNPEMVTGSWDTVYVTPLKMTALPEAPDPSPEAEKVIEIVGGQKVTLS
jgi:hypothetical protein